jgi:SSS family transporter
LNLLDWAVIVAYIIIIIVLALYLTRKQKNTEDYYLGGRKIKWWQSGASTMATQLGAISFVSAPAFVALKDGGGLKWLCYEFSVPLALVPVMAIIIPVLHRHHYISIYEYLENRFNRTTRTLVSSLFQLGRGLATAVAVLAGGLILSTAFSISTYTAIILIGVITIIYDALGGIKVVILSDFLQMMIILIGIVICGSAALSLVGWQQGWASLEPSHLQILDFSRWGFSPDGQYGFWPMVIGGFFLYISYYGTDQSQVQRELSVGNETNVKKSLLVNAFGRFPLVLSYCLMGVFVGAVISQPGTFEIIGEALGISGYSVQTILNKDPDRLVPMFIITFLPHGIIGFIFVAIMAALMSSLDSGLNSLSAVTMRDFYQRYFKKNASDSHYLIVSKLFTLGWGVFCVVAALLFYKLGEATRQTTIVLINAVGSMLYGPILAAFSTGMLIRKVNAAGINIGILSGILLNFLLWQFTEISWLWWNFTGFLVSALLAYFISIIWSGRKDEFSDSTIKEKIFLYSDKKWIKIYVILGLYFFLIIFISYLIQSLGSS